VILTWVKREVSPIIEEYAQKQNSKTNHQRLSEIGGFWTLYPCNGGAGLDQISYGLIMQEIERGDSGVRSTSLYNHL
jgi:glutaryl-CoA dehydrogenase